MTSFIDAYPPQDGTDYSIIKLTTKRIQQSEEQAIDIATHEFVRVPTAAWQSEDNPYAGQDEVGFADSTSQLAQLKTKYNAVTTDALDKEGVQLSAKESITTITKTDAPPQSMRTSTHCKNNLVHSPQTKEKFYRPAIIEDNGYKRIDIYALDGVKDNVIQPDKSIQAGKEIFQGDKRITRLYIENNRLQNLKDEHGKVIALADTSYDPKTDAVISEGSYEDGLAQDLVLGPMVVPSMQGLKSDGNRIILFKGRGQPKERIVDDTLLPFHVTLDTEGLPLHYEYKPSSAGLHRDEIGTRHSETILQQARANAADLSAHQLAKMGKVIAANIKPLAAALN